MRAVATLLIAAMAVLLLLAWHFRTAHPAMPWLAAFAEAGLVGGLADWFAVTALFRHPLGLPIPHTAIIPRSKDRLGDTLAQFLKDNFLTPKVVARRLEAADPALALAGWLTRPRTTRRRGLAPLLARLIEALDTEAVSKLVADTATARLSAMPLSPIVADLVDQLVKKGRHEPVIDAGIDWALAALSSEEPRIRGMVAERTNWFLRLVNVDESVSDSLIQSVQKLLIEVRGDPQHPLRGKLEQSLKGWAFDLRNFPEAQTRVEAVKTDLITSPTLRGWASGLWQAARDSLLASVSDPDSTEASRLTPALTALGERLQQDATLRAGINRALRRTLVGLVADYGDDIVALVSDTVRSWDADTVTDRVEQAVGRDLQFIRINGTLIGGCIGLGLHAAIVLVG
jgi:uncharacterized membrane-anchored protein YjiN (DUF445 family)